MAETQHQTQQLTVALASLRTQMLREALLLGTKLNVKRHFLYTVRSYPFACAICAAFFCWLLSRIPPLEKRIYIDSSSQKPVKTPDKHALNKVSHGMWKFLKPVIAAYLANLVEENASQNGSNKSGNRLGEDL